MNLFLGILIFVLFFGIISYFMAKDIGWKAVVWGWFLSIVGTVAIVLASLLVTNRL